MTEFDTVNHPKHYNQHPVCEAIDLCEELTFNLGNAVKYLWRAGKKGDAIEDMKKALWYLKREAARLLAYNNSNTADEEPLAGHTTIGSIGIPNSAHKLVEVLLRHGETPEVLKDVLKTLLDPEDSVEVAVHIISQAIGDADSSPVRP